jgi:hypothetical protein
MSAAYKGRHTGAVDRTPAVGGAPGGAGGSARTPAGGRAHTPSSGRAHTTARGFSRALRRPLVSAAVILAVAAVSAAGTSEAVPFSAPSGPSFTASPMAVSQSLELSHNRQDTNAALAAARRSGVQRASALTQAQNAAAVALTVARAQAAIELATARRVQAQQVARDLVRQAVISSAQQDPKSVARLLAADRGWGDGQFSCLDSLWTKESGWSFTANNASSGAYGIPQSLPGSKMSAFGSDWATNPVTQIKWGLQYIGDRYGSPCGAWAQSQATNWY